MTFAPKICPVLVVSKTTSEICEWCGAKRGCQILQVAGKGLAEEARVAIARELMDMLDAGTPFVGVKARKLELLSAVV